MRSLSTFPVAFHGAAESPSCPTISTTAVLPDVKLIVRGQPGWLTSEYVPMKGDGSLGHPSLPSPSILFSPSLTQQIPVPVNFPSKSTGPPFELRSTTIRSLSTFPKAFHGP